ncbi:leukocyte-specific transcript 1 protein isoform X2 [Choloepus didactylus]|uniref:leukocyte-specific transcript 1 protein isoform X2 n=1 Tax=Choloepus didactylus TaxID=27675 RepID=UPI0018A0161A|nr:leukocyte-specific transcript 1 protein isoform X2 [Choloepus didactylus]
MVKRLERSWTTSSQQELHYASLQRLPGGGGGPDHSKGEEEAAKKDPSTDYACVAKNKPT